MADKNTTLRSIEQYYKLVLYLSDKIPTRLIERQLINADKTRPIIRTAINSC